MLSYVITMTITKTITKTMNKKEPTMSAAPSLRGRVGEEPPFEIRSYKFGELAQLYYPDHTYDSALRLFRREMHETRGMWQAMQAVGYKDYTKVLTRAQVKVIVKFLDPPY